MIRVLAFILTLFMGLTIFAACAGASETPTPRPTSTPRPTVAPLATPTTFVLEQPTVVAGTTPTATPVPLSQGDLLAVPEAIYGGTMRNLIDRNIRNCRMGMSRGTDRVTTSSCGPLTNSLLRYYPGDTIGPDLAESWAFSEGGTVLTMNLRDDVLWHDGVPFTAEDVVWNFQQWLLGGVPGGELALIRFSGIHGKYHTWFCEGGVLACTEEEAADAVVAVDPYTVRFTSLFPVGVMIPAFATVRETAMHPKHVLDPLPPEERSPLRYDQIIGTGAYKVRSLTEGSVMIGQRNDDYFVEGLPYLNGYEMYILSDPSLRLGNLLTKQLDVYSGAEVPFADAEGIMKSSQADNITIITYYPVQSFYNYINATTSDIMDDIKVREAVFLAMDLNDANRILGRDEGIIGSWMSPIGNYSLPESEYMALPGMDASKRDEQLARARELMAEAGYADGVTIKPLYTRNVVRDVEQAIWTADQLAKIGITTEVQPVEGAVLSEKRESLDIDISTVYTATTLDEPENFMLGFDCTVAGQDPSPFDGVCTPELDAMIFEVQATIDFAKRKELTNEIERIMNGTFTYQRLFWTPRKVAHWNYVKGWQPAGVSQYHQYNTRFDTMYFDRS